MSTGTWWWASIAALVLSACGGTVRGGGTDEAAAGAAGSDPGTGGTGGTGGTAPSFPKPDGGDPGAFDGGYIDPSCPDAPPPRPDWECNPFAVSNECGEGLSCSPYALYPESPCDTELFGTQCTLAGSAVQGEVCGAGVRCASGHVCVHTSLGTQCVQMCPPRGEDTCAPGFVCVPIDVEGIGGCF